MYKRWIIYGAVLLLAAAVPSGAASCPDGCVCMSPGDAKLLGYELCGKDKVVCGYVEYPTHKEELYCYQLPSSCDGDVCKECPEGCVCLSEEEWEKTGYGTCGDLAISCGKDRYCFALPGITVATTTATTAPTTIPTITVTVPTPTLITTIPTIQPTLTPTPFPTCSDGCECLTDMEAERLGMTAWCDGNVTQCGESGSGVPMYCRDEPPLPECRDWCKCMPLNDQKELCDGEEVLCGYEMHDLTTAPIPCYCYEETGSKCPEGSVCLLHSFAETFGYELTEPPTECGYNSSLAELRYCYKEKPASCIDGIQNRDEEGVDCGGTYCAPCPDPCLSASLPANFSWRTYKGTNWLTPVKHQHGCMGCWAFSSVGAAEANWKIGWDETYENTLMDQVIDLSEMHLVCYYGCPGDCKSGGWPSDALSFMKGHGIVDEECYPFNTSLNTTFLYPCLNERVCGDWPDHIWKVYDWDRISIFDTAFDIQTRSSYLKGLLLCKGPLVVCSDNWWHCIVLVGWDDGYVLVDNNNKTYPQGAWIIRNSWGTGWGEGGYGYIPYYGHSFSDLIWDVWSVEDTYYRWHA